MPIACIGHWYTSMLYFAPVGGIGAALKISTWREKRRQARELRAADDAPAAPSSVLHPVA